MKVPVFLNIPIVNHDGHATVHFRQVMDELLSQLQQNFSDNGVGVPNVSSQTATKLSASGDGTLVYMTHDDPTQNGFYGVVNGTFKKLQTS